MIGHRDEQQFPAPRPDPNASEADLRFRSLKFSHFRGTSVSFSNDPSRVGILEKHDPVAGPLPFGGPFCGYVCPRRPKCVPEHSENIRDRCRQFRFGGDQISGEFRRVQCSRRPPQWESNVGVTFDGHGPRCVPRLPANRASVNWCLKNETASHSFARRNVSSFASPLRSVDQHVRPDNRNRLIDFMQGMKTWFSPSASRFGHSNQYNPVHAKPSASLPR